MSTETSQSEHANINSATSPPPLYFQIFSCRTLMIKELFGPCKAFALHLEINHKYVNTLIYIIHPLIYNSIPPKK